MGRACESHQIPDSEHGGTRKLGPPYGFPGPRNSPASPSFPAILPLPHPGFFDTRSHAQFSCTIILGRRRHARAPCRIACLHRHGHHRTRGRPRNRPSPIRPISRPTTSMSAAGRAKTTTRPTSSRREPRSRSIAMTRAVGSPFARPKTASPGSPAHHLQLDGGNLATVTDERRRGPGRQPHERHPRRDPGPPAQGRSGRSARTAHQQRRPAATPSSHGLVQDRAAGGRVPLGLRPLRRHGLRPRRPAADLRPAEPSI